MRTLKIKTGLLLLLLLASVTLFAQYDIQVSSKNKKAVKAYKKALACFDNINQYGVRDLKGAEENLMKAKKYDPNFVEVYFILSVIYEEKKETEPAIENLKKVVELNENFFPDVLFFLGKLEFSAGKYDDAFAHFNRYAAQKGLSDERYQQLELLMQSCEFAKKAVASPVKFEPVNLGPGVNTYMGEYFPCITADDQTLLFTRQIEVDPSRGSIQEDFFVSKIKEGVWQKGTGISTRINTQYNEGAPSLSPDGQVLIFVACEVGGEYGEGRNGVGSCDLFITYKYGDEWDFPSNIGEPVNTGQWESQPSYSNDGKTLFFVRAVPEIIPGVKNSDIFISELDKKGNWSKPQKLGTNINTPYMESSVLIHPDGQTLYFSSNGHPGMGGQDIYMVRKGTDGKWGKPVNLGYPINTNSDENSLLVSSNGSVAFFASDRPGGYGGLDLYSFEMPEEVRPQVTTYMKGVVFDSETKDKLEAKFELTDLQTGEVVVTSFSNPGNGEFLVAIATNRDYALAVEKQGYKFYSKNFSLTAKTENTEPYLMDIPLDPLSSDGGVTLENVFFDLNSANLRKESYYELDKLVDLLNKNPAYKAEIMGHTDNRGVKKDNQLLSENRAKSVMDYLVSKGIDKKRLTSAGYGDTKPVVADAQTEEEHQKNRRTEYRLYK
jgi:outer membrane protein OmpA-like peptidoglycan-associated protein